MKRVALEGFSNVICQMAYTSNAVWCMTESMTSLKILALDPGTITGWAHSCGASGTWDLSVRRDESDGMRLIRLRGKLSETLDASPFELLVFEASRNLKFGAPIRVAGEIQGQIKVWAIDHKIDFRGYSATEIKRRISGKGNANKALMMKVARRLGYHGNSQDEADARLVLAVATHDYLTAPCWKLVRNGGVAGPIEA